VIRLLALKLSLVEAAYPCGLPVPCIGVARLGARAGRIRVLLKGTSGLLLKVDLLAEYSPLLTRKGEGLPETSTLNKW
jgi:hypothetical protein